ncbi:MAG: dihydrodipicolinate synthase family protein [Deinococcales bacterium]
MQLPKGSLVPLPTPFTGSDNRIDLAALKNFIEFQISHGSHGLGCLGTTGEPSSQSLEERKAVTEFVLQEVKGRVPVMPGTGTTNFDETMELTHHAVKAGADAVLIITPYYIRPNQNNLFTYFKTIADSIPNTPIMLYNIPGRTA